MPRYHFVCDSCHTNLYRILKVGGQREVQWCPAQCGTQMRRAQTGGTSSQVKETLDNGIMARRVERLVNAPQLSHDRAAADPRRRPR